MKTIMENFTKDMLLYFVRKSGVKGYSKLNKPNLIKFMMENNIEVDEEILTLGVREFTTRSIEEEIKEIERKCTHPSYCEVVNIVDIFLGPLFDRQDSYFERLSSIKGVTIDEENIITFKPPKAKQVRRYKIGLHGLSYQHPFDNELSSCVNDYLNLLFDEQNKYFEELNLIEGVEITPQNSILIPQTENVKKYYVGIYNVF